MLGVIATAFVAPLVLGVGEPPDRALRELATCLAAVRMTSVVRTTDDELLRALAARQREDHELVHPVWMGENWTATLDTTTVTTY